SGALAWTRHLAALGSELDARAATARALLAGGTAPDSASLIAALGNDEINVTVADEQTGDVTAWVDGRAAGVHPLPPPGAFPGGPAPGAFPPPGSPAGPPRRRGGFGALVSDAAHVAPRRAAGDGITVELVVSQAALVRWLAADVFTCLAALAAIAVAAWLASAAFVRAALRPLLRTTAALEALASGDFTPQQIEAGDAPEIARLARAYNAAAETVARSIEERRAAAAEFQRFLADAGHELRTPLTIVGGYADILARFVAIDDPAGPRAIAGMRAEIGRMRGLVEKMLLLSRLESARSEPRVVDVGMVSEEVAEAMRPGYPGRSIVVRCDAATRVCIDEDDLYEAQRNLVENALRYAPGSPVEVIARARGGAVEIEVADRGPGIPEREQSMVFERFYRGKDRTDTEGSGLGLAIVRRIVERWRGSIALHSDPSGTRFVMRFPQADPS
ncbi:MAG TPA: HAMP domain-containing sensor histidine kinase, partial [Verrucomicrobiae bacterium]|nr:HAMP domain-containing sensor histidine kinase [Verrucomicrobiae bacterium]